MLTEPGGLADGFGQVFREVADVSSGFFGAAEDAFDVYLGAEADDVCGFGQLVTGLFPSWERRPGVGVGEGLGSGVPDREPVVGVEELVVCGLPDLVVGRRGDRAQLAAGDGSPDGGMEMGSAAFLGFDGAEVLHIPADAAAGVLPESIDQRWEMDRVPRCALVVIPVGINRRSLVVYASVGIEGEGEEG